LTFQHALYLGGTYAIAIPETQGTDLMAIGIASRDRGPVTSATDFSVAGYVDRKLTKREISKKSVNPFESIFAQTVGKAASAIDLQRDLILIESGGPFQPLVGLEVPAAERGLHGGRAAEVDTQTYTQSIVSGIGITNPIGYPASLSVGTLGFFVTNGNDTYLVSNNHVIGGACDKSGLQSVIGNPVVQPGTLDLTDLELLLMPTSADLVKATKIADVSGVVPLRFTTPKNTPHNRVDTALAKLDPASSRSLGDLAKVAFGGRILGTSAFTPDPGDPNKVKGDARVHKTGRTTGLTEALAVVSPVDYRGKTAYFVDQIAVRATGYNRGPFSLPGDSGSGVLNSSHELVGLLFAGGPTRTLVNPIDDVLKALRSTFPQGSPSLTLVTS